jgi:integral membrane sensor domain MASE1
MEIWHISTQAGEWLVLPGDTLVILLYRIQNDNRPASRLAFVVCGQWIYAALAARIGVTVVLRLVFFGTTGARSSSAAWRSNSAWVIMTRPPWCFVRRSPEAIMYAMALKDSESR